ncbi:MAG: hypothetical protein RR293_00170 [Bacteroidales bacterium]
MKKSLLSIAFIAALVLGTANVYAQAPKKNEVKKEQTATVKKDAKAEKCAKTNCTQQKTTTPASTTPASKSTKK